MYAKGSNKATRDLHEAIERGDYPSWTVYVQIMTPEQDDGGGGGPNYYPNTFGGPAPRPEVAEPPFEVTGKAARQPYSHPNDDFAQPGALYRDVMNDEERARLIGNIVDHLGGAQKRLQLRQAALFYKVDPDYGAGVAKGLGLDMAKVKSLAEMSQEERVKATI